MWQFKSGKEIWVEDREIGFIIDWGQSEVPRSYQRDVTQPR